MSTKQTRLFVLETVALLILSYVPDAQAQLVESIWTCGTGNYSSSTCWYPPIAKPPYNNNIGSFMYDVNIPANKGTISMDLDIQPCAVNSFFLGDDSTFRVLSGNEYKVVGQAELNGTIYSYGGSFIAPNTTRIGNTALIWADAGGKVEIGVPSYSSVDLPSGAEFMKSTGSGSRLSLPSCKQLDDRFSINNGWHRISARNGGVLDLSGLETIIEPEKGYLIIWGSLGGSINLDRLRTITHAQPGDTGYVQFDLNDDTILELHALSSADRTLFDVSNGATLIADPLLAYSAADLWSGAEFMKSTGNGSRLSLPSCKQLDDRFSINNGWHRISARNGGVIDLSALETILGPEYVSRSIIEADNGTVDMSSLASIAGNQGRVEFTLRNNGKVLLGNVTSDILMAITLYSGSTLQAQGLCVTKAATITLNGPNDLLDIRDGFDLSTSITVSNPGQSMLALGGDFTYAHKDKTKAPFAKSYVFFNGNGPQELEVGGWDVDVWTEALADDNFGYGQMVIGEPNQPTAVLLVDQIDNGNPVGLFGATEDALYLFGKDGQDGLRILGGSTLYLNGLHVYA